MIGFRHVDRRYPFLWEGPDQPPARWHGEGEGPAYYFADTPDGAWAEFLRHEEISDPADLPGVERAIWAVELGDPPGPRPPLARATLVGGRHSYPACRQWASRFRRGGGAGFRATSAALLPGRAAGWRVEGGLQAAAGREGEVIVLFGARPDLLGWLAALGRPTPGLLGSVRHLDV